MTISQTNNSNKNIFDTIPYSTEEGRYENDEIKVDLEQRPHHEERRKSSLPWKKISTVTTDYSISSEAKFQGPEEQQRLPLKHRLQYMLYGRIQVKNRYVREFLAEFIGMFVFLLIGTSANVQARKAFGGMTNPNTTNISFAWGFGFMFAVYLAASISGAHLNPAITFCSWLLGDLPFIKVFTYSFAQLLGAFCGSGISFIGHLDDINKIGNNELVVYGVNATAGLFTTYAADHITTVGAFFDQLIGTSILSGCITLITDKRLNIPPCLVPMLAGLLMTMIALSYGANAGFANNPARDLGPRLFTLAVGYGTDVFTYKNYYFWIPLIAPFPGAIIGCLVYKLFVGLHGGEVSMDMNLNIVTEGDKKSLKGK